MSTTYVEGLGGIDKELSKIGAASERQAATFEKLASILERKLKNEAELNQAEVDRRMDAWRKEVGRKVLDYIGTEAPRFDYLYEQTHSHRPAAVIVAERILKIFNEVKP